MKKIFLMMLTITMAWLASCSDKSQELNDLNQCVETVDDVAQFSLTKFGVSKTDLLSYLKLMYPKHEVRFVKPIANAGQLDAYYVQYDKGWAVISADKRCSPMLVSSDEGIVELQDTTNLLVKSIKSSIEQANVMASGAECISPIWAFLSGGYQQNEQLDSRKKSGRVARRDGYGMWIATDTTSYDVLTYRNHLITTNWTQGSPYNNYCPYHAYQIYEHCPTGCVPLAVGQVLCYFRENCTTNVAIPSAAHLPAANYTSFVVDSYSSAIWSQLRTNNNYAAMFLAQLGADMNTSYTLAYAATYVDSIPGCLNKYRVGCSSISGFSHALVENNILGYSPVIASVGDNMTSDGHTFIFDAISINKTYMHVNYVWDPDYEPTYLERQRLPAWMLEPMYDKDGIVTEYAEDFLFSESSSVGTNMCLETLSRPWYPYYQKFYPYIYHDESGSYQVPGDEHYWPLNILGYSTFRRLFYNLYNF